MKGKVISMKKKNYKELKKQVKVGKAILTMYETDTLPDGVLFQIDKEACNYNNIKEFKKDLKKMEKKVKKEKVKRMRRKLTFGLWK